MKLVTVGKDKGNAMESVALEYVKKIQRYCAFEEVQLRPNPKNARQACKLVTTSHYHFFCAKILIIHVLRK